MIYWRIESISHEVIEIIIFNIEIKKFHNEAKEHQKKRKENSYN